MKAGNKQAARFRRGCRARIERHGSEGFLRPVVRPLNCLQPKVPQKTAGKSTSYTTFAQMARWGGQLLSASRGKLRWRPGRIYAKSRSTHCRIGCLRLQHCRCPPERRGGGKARSLCPTEHASGVQGCQDGISTCISSCRFSVASPWRCPAPVPERALGVSGHFRRHTEVHAVRYVFVGCVPLTC